MVKVSRQTKQKALLDKQIKSFSTFFTGEELYQKVKSRDPNLGIATVYRFLKNLKQQNKLHSYVCDRRVLYSREHKSHCHFTCEKCGKLSHISIEKLDFIKDKIEGDICHFQLDVLGICNNCKK